MFLLHNNKLCYIAHPNLPDEERSFLMLFDLSFRLLQTVMVMTLVNGYLAFKYMTVRTDKELTLMEITNSVELADVPSRVRMGRGVLQR